MKIVWMLSCFNQKGAKHTSNILSEDLFLKKYAGLEAQMNKNSAKGF